MATTPYSERLTSSEFTQQTMLSDLSQQKWLVGAGIGAVALLWMWLRRGSDSRQEAARHLVRDWRHVDDFDGARDLLGSNVPAIVRPALLIMLGEIQHQTHRGFRRVEKSIERM